MFRCDRCGEVFEGPRVVYHSYYEPLDYVCPYCGSAEMTEGHFCEGCGEFIEEEGFATDSYCDKCIDDAISVLKAHLNDDRVKMTEAQKKAFLEYLECV